MERTKQETDRYSSSEIKRKPTFSVKAYQKWLEDLARKIRLINGQIQEANWKDGAVNLGETARGHGNLCPGSENTRQSSAEVSATS